MCGIVGYIGRKDIIPVLLDGLRALEYRGYDSAGVAFWKGGELKVVKTPGKVESLAALLTGIEGDTLAGIAHTRWATHGEPNEVNAHPHFDCGGDFYLAHNGVIENYRELRNSLLENGHAFNSETDTETIAHLLEEERKISPELKLEELMLRVLPKLRGTFGLAIVSKYEPRKLVAIRNFSPLILGVGESEYIVASDAVPIMAHTRQMIYLDDGEMAVITPEKYSIIDIKSQITNEKPVEVIEGTPEEAKKNGYPHFTLKEIMEQPNSLRNSLRGRLFVEEGKAQLGGLADVKDRLRSKSRITITACGTAYLAGQVAKYMFEEYAGIKTDVELASEFRYRKPILDDETVVLAISQSGETADTIGAIREAKEKGVTTLGIVNVVGSTIARATDAGVYNHAGPEIGVASTKAFTSQLAIASLYTLFLGRQRGMSLVMGKRIARELSMMPELVAQTLESIKDEVKFLAEKYVKYNNYLYIGRKYNYPVAYEGALKLKELSYVHAEGYASGEMKHGPIAMVDENFPTVAVVPKDSVYEKNISNMQEIKARRGPIIAIATEGDRDILSVTKDVLYVPKTLEMFTPFLTVLPLQLFAYYSAALRGLDVDKPRNLAKSVTVE